MVRRRAIRWLSLAAALCTSAALSGCKQSEGDRCEVNNDCAAGLTCDNLSGTSGRCTSKPGSTLPPVDAAVPVVRDGATSDAMSDAAPDAMRDVAPPDLALDSVDAPAADVALDVASEAMPRDGLPDAVVVD
jgi:hypothetical protein